MKPETLWDLDLNSIPLFAIIIADLLLPVSTRETEVLESPILRDLKWV
jgi:hypothetical protein